MATIRQATPPNLIGQPRVEFNKNNFDALIWQKGYPIIHYDAIECPCKGSTAPRVDCQNCLGLGWVFINPISTRGIVTSINVDTKFKHWSPEMRGTISLTTRDIERMSFMDKIVFKDKYSVLSEAKEVRYNDSQAFIFTSYPVVGVNVLFLFKNSYSPLIRLNKEEFEVSEDNKYVVKINSDKFPQNFNGYASIDYKYELQYNVVDMPHELRSSVLFDRRDGKKEDFDLPVQAICQKSHYVNGDSPKYDGTGVVENSFLK